MSDKFSSTIYSGTVRVGIRVGKKVIKYGDGKSYTKYYLVIKGKCTGLSLPEELTYVQTGDSRTEVPISEGVYNKFIALKKISKKACPIRAIGTLEIIADID